MLLSFRKVKAIYLINPHKTSARQLADNKMEGREKNKQGPPEIAASR